MYPKALECIQSEHDRQVLKAILAQITSVNFTAKLQGVRTEPVLSFQCKGIHPSQAYKIGGNTKNFSNC